MKKLFTTQSFDIHISNAKNIDSTVQAFPRRDKTETVRKSPEGKKVNNVSVALYTNEHSFIDRIKHDEDLRQTILQSEEDIDLEIIGKTIGNTTSLLLTIDNTLCYNFTEYEIKKDREGNVIPCNECGEIYCEHRIKRQTESNVNEEAPIRWIKPIMIDKLEAIKRYSFEKSYIIRHNDGASYEYLYEMARQLHEANQMVLMAPIEEKKPQKVVLRNRGKPFYAFLEGRVNEDNKTYLLILHRTTFSLK